MTERRLNHLPDEIVNVTLSVGQTKIGTGAVDRQGNLICRLPEIATPQDSSARFAAIVRQILATVREVGQHNVGCVGLSYPELVAPPDRWRTDSDNLTGDSNPIQEMVARLVAAELSAPLDVEVLHDAAAAVLGEVSIKGSKPACNDCVFIVWGTGVASGIISDGKLYWKDPVINTMTGEIGLQVVRKASGLFEYRPSVEIPLLRPAELRMDRWLRGPEIARRCAQRIGADARGETLLQLAEKKLDDLDLVDINRAARRGDALAIELIEGAGHEMGRALAPFIHYWLRRKKRFAETIIIGSGVAKLGDGLIREGEGLLIGAIRRAIGCSLTQAGIDDYDTGKVIISSIGYEREFYAFIPE